MAMLGHIALNNAGLTEFPVEFLTMTNLSFIELDHNAISVIPPDIANLKYRLVRLSLAGNPIQDSAKAVLRRKLPKTNLHF